MQSTDNNLSRVAPEQNGCDDFKRIFAGELLAHRENVRQCLAEWSLEQESILERALERASVGTVPARTEGTIIDIEGGDDYPCKAEASNGTACTAPKEDDNDLDKPNDIVDCTSLDPAPLVVSTLKPEYISAPRLERQKSPASPKLKRQTSTTSCDSHERIHRQATELGFRRILSKKKSGLSNMEDAYLKNLSLLVFSKHFESICGTVIVLNAVLLGVASDYAMSHLDDPEHPAISAIELGFCCFYFVEVCLRISVLGCAYFRSADSKWNKFDLALVILAIWDQIQARLDTMSALENLSFLRLLRLMKMLKLLRMIRLMRMFRELRLILYSVLGCVHAMFWATVLIITTSYMFGICFLQACTNYLQSNDQADLNPKVVGDIAEYWSSVSTVMLSLYMAATAGREWSAVAWPLRSVGWPFYLLFLLYIAFFAFVVMNTVTSLFIEATISNADKDQNAIIQMELEKKDKYIMKLQSFYDEIDEDEDGQISFEEFCHHVNTPEMRAFATSLEIDVLDAKQFFCILSDHGRRSVDIETFVVGCIKLRGAARSMDLMDLMYEQKESHSENRKFHEQQLGAVKDLEKMLMRKLAAAPSSIKRVTSSSI